MFLPTTKEEIFKLGWQAPDIIIVSGDTYIDSPFNGSAVIGNYLTINGFKVAIIAQPDINSNEITRLGEPSLYWTVSAGAMDSLVANYTATGKFRNEDDLTPGGINNRRPNRACMVYTNLIRRYFKNTKPIVLGGIEASLRRVVHYDLKDKKLRRSLLFDAKADILVYGMAEKTMLELSLAIKNNQDFRDIKGLCYISKEPKTNYIDIASFEECIENPNSFREMFKTFYNNSAYTNSKGLNQKHDKRYLIHNPPQDFLTQEELDTIYDMDFTREVHPYYAKQGKVKAQDTIKFSVVSHRGCCGECNFCAIAVHQGKSVISRSKKSIIKEINQLAQFADFKGYISDVGGPTGNMYKITCKVNDLVGKCKDKKCLYPKVCQNLVFSHNEQIDLLKEISKNKKIKKVFISSGIRHDLIIADSKDGINYLKYISKNNISGQLKIAPEHICDTVLDLMGKPKQSTFLDFMKDFKHINKPLNQFLTCYFMVAHPGCTLDNCKELVEFIKKNMAFSPEQVQVFTPTPSTFSTMMYYTKQDIDGNDIFVEKDRNARMKQKLEIIQLNSPKINNIDSRKFNYSKRTNLKYSNNNNYSNNKFRKKH